MQATSSRSRAMAAPVARMVAAERHIPASRHITRQRTNAQVSFRRPFFSLPDISKLASLAPGASQGADGVSNSGDVQKFHARKILG